jgi:hypothetical protein
MDAFIFCLYKDRWVLTSAEQVAGGATLLAPPVRIVAHGDRAKLKSVLDELLQEEPPTVPHPDYNSPRFFNDLRLEPLGLKKWREFVKDARCFIVERRGEMLLLEEWPREAGNFSAKASWSREFPGEDTVALVEHLITVTPLKPQRPKRT